MQISPITIVLRLRGMNEPGVWSLESEKSRVVFDCELVRTCVRNIIFSIARGCSCNARADFLPQSKRIFFSYSSTCLVAAGAGPLPLSVLPRHCATCGSFHPCVCIHNIIICMYAYEQTADRIQPPLDGSTACPTIINPPLFAPLPKIRD